MFLQKSYQVFNLKMNNIRSIKGGVNLKGKVKVPGDKSISHREIDLSPGTFTFPFKLTPPFIARILFIFKLITR